MVITIIITINYFLVNSLVGGFNLYLPLWKIYESMGFGWHPIIWNGKSSSHVWNHQLVMVDFPWFFPAAFDWTVLSMMPGFGHDILYPDHSPDCFEGTHIYILINKYIYIYMIIYIYTVYIYIYMYIYIYIILRLLKKINQIKTAEMLASILCRLSDLWTSFIKKMETQPGT